MPQQLKTIHFILFVDLQKADIFDIAFNTDEHLEVLYRPHPQTSLMHKDSLPNAVGFLNKD